VSIYIMLELAAVAGTSMGSVSRALLVHLLLLVCGVAPAAVTRASKIDHKVVDVLSPTVIGLNSRFYVGAAPGGFSCTAAVHEDLFRISHSFGAGGGGELWQHSALIIEIPPQLRARSVATGRTTNRSSSAVLLRLVANVTLLHSSTSYALRASPIQEDLHVPMHLEVNEGEECPPQPCLPPAPQVPVRVARPECGWALPEVTLSLPITVDDGHGLTFEADIAPLLELFDVKAVKLWSSPTSVSTDGLWQTPLLKLRSLSLHMTSGVSTFI